MNLSNIKIDYPQAISKSTQTDIIFYNGQPDLVSTFKPGNSEGKRLFVTDKTIAKLSFMKSFISSFNKNKCGSDSLLILGAGEAFKTIDNVLEIVKTGLDAGLNRNDTFIAIGGGVICDITGFASSIYKRGAKLEFVPTTLLAMVDASVGGKTGCDYESYKNMIGSFYPALKIHYWPYFVQSLSEEQYKSGLAEAFKTGILFDRELFNLFKNESDKILKRNPDLLDSIIYKCAKAKAEVVEKDLFEKNIRTTLNLGHTFGHAFESAAGLGTVTHGEAVAWGIGRVTCLSLIKGYCSESFKDDIFKTMALYGWDTSAVPKELKSKKAVETLLQIMHKDKKNNTDKIRLIIPKDIENIIMEETEDSDIIKCLK